MERESYLGCQQQQILDNEKQEVGKIQENEGIDMDKKYAKLYNERLDLDKIII